jgi:hypothetical protein
MLLTAGVSSSVVAQLPANNTSSNDQSPSEAISPIKKSNGIRITSPIDGEQISSNGKSYFDKNGENLSIKGFSTYENNNSSNCKVFVIINNVKPYQLTNATGKTGNDDYSTWQYNFNSFYTPFKEGSNKITSKLTCQPGNTNSFYSVNVTGSTINGTFPSNAQTPMIIGNNSSTSAFLVKQTNTTTASTPAAISASPLKQTNTTTASTPATVNTGSINLNPKSGVIPHVGSSTSTITPLKQTNTTTASTPPTANTGSINLNPKSTGTPKIGQTAPTTPTEKAGTTNQNPQGGAIPHIGQTAPTTPTEKAGTINLNPKSTGTPTIGQPTTSTQLGLKLLDVNIDSKGSGDNQDIVITVKDSITNNPINGASINGKMNGISISGKTDSDGELSKGIPSKVFESSTSADVSVTVNANGYKPTKADTTLRITPDATPDTDNTDTTPDTDNTDTTPDTDNTDTTPDTDNTDTTPDTDNTDTTPDTGTDSDSSIGDSGDDNVILNNQGVSKGKDLAAKIFNDVQQQLSKQGINIPLPFG